MTSTIAVAMSGGLDSSVVAHLLSREVAGDGEGSVIGLSMLLWDRSAEATHGRCCGALDLGDARRVAAQCGIPHYTLPMEDEFRRYVVDPFVEDVLSGSTPVPCTQCNTWIKFALFLDRARSLGAAKMATGHYARIERGDGEWELHQAAHVEKDQSYYLFELTQEQLAASLFPLGSLPKEKVRDIARTADLVVAEKGESMELCFVSGSIREFVEEEAAAAPERFPSPAGAGATVRSTTGEVLGEGEPYYRYTVGQRRGLGVSSQEKLYVLGVNSRENEITVGPEQALEEDGLVGRGLHWIGRPPTGPVTATVKIRSRHPGVRCEVEPVGDGGARIHFEAPQRGVAPGQAAVFYDGTRVLGGCWIESALPSDQVAVVAPRTLAAGRTPA